MTDAKLKRDAFLVSVLEAVNVGREVLGHEPISEMPKGEVGRCETCPLALALRPLESPLVLAIRPLEWVLKERRSVDVSTSDVWLSTRTDEVKRALASAWGTEVEEGKHGRGLVVKLPSPLRTFVKKFDARLYPELEASR